MIDTAGKVAGVFTVTGQLSGVAQGTSIILDLYSNKVPDSSGAGEGQTFLGEVTVVTTDANGSFSAAFAKAPAAGASISLTARVADGTSEFSLDKTV